MWNHELHYNHALVNRLHLSSFQENAHLVSHTRSRGKQKSATRPQFRLTSFNYRKYTVARARLNKIDLRKNASDLKTAGKRCAKIALCTVLGHHCNSFAGASMYPENEAFGCLFPCISQVAVRSRLRSHLSGHASIRGRAELIY